MAAKSTATLGIMAAIAVLMQGAAFWFPGPGHALATAASLPMLLAAYVGGRRAFWSYVAAALLLVLIHLQEALLFSLMTGPVGLAAGWGLRRDWSLLLRALLIGIALTAGLFTLGYLLQLPPMGPAVQQMNAAWAIYLGFSLVWGLLWAVLAPRAVRLLWRTP